jgi:Flagellar basal body-associated protein
MLKNPHFKWRHSLQMIAASAMILALMTSCSSSGASKSSADYAADYSDGYSFSNRDYSEEATKELSEDTAVSEGKKTEEITDSQYEDKIIRTANISMESTDAQKCYDTLVAFAKQNGGREISVSKSNDSYGNYDYINIQAELKIAPEKLDEFIALAEKTDKVTNSQISTNDITQEYYDIKLRLETKKEALKNYYKLLKEASTIEESLEVQRYITDLTAEIESMEGMLRYYDSKVDLSTIHLDIRQQVKLHVGAEDDFQWDSLSFRDFITLIKNGFLSVVNFLWSLLLWIIIIVIAISPLLLIVGIILFVFRRYRKKHPKKPKKVKQPRPVNMVPGYMPAYYPPAQPNAPVNTTADPAAPAAETAPKETSGQ